MTQLDTALQGMDLTPEQERLVREYVSSRTKRANVNSNKVKATITLGDGTPLTLGIGKKSGYVRVYGLRNRLPIALPVAKWEQIFEATGMIRDFIAKNSEHFDSAPAAVVAENNAVVAENKSARKRVRK